MITRKRLGWITFASPGPNPYKVNTSWRCPDTDSDLICQAIDNCPGISNSGQEDGDLDTVGNACDNCPNTANTSQVDFDSDGQGDHCDVVIEELEKRDFKVKRSGG